MLIRRWVFWSLPATDEINVVNKDSPIDSLTLINQKTTTSSTYAGRHYSVILDAGAQSIDLKE